MPARRHGAGRRQLISMKRVYAVAVIVVVFTILAYLEAG
jgi:hypothetical protein